METTALVDQCRQEWYHAHCTMEFDDLMKLLGDGDVYAVVEALRYLFCEYSLELSRTFYEHDIILYGRSDYALVEGVMKVCIMYRHLCLSFSPL